MRKIIITRGTNPELWFRTPQALMYDSTATMTIAQRVKRQKIVIEKECGISGDGRTVSATLTEDETMKLRGGRCAEIQFCYNIGDEKVVSPIQTAEIKEKIGADSDGTIRRV